jgi:hypothetical protein
VGATKLKQAAQGGAAFAPAGEAQTYLNQQIARQYYDPNAEYSFDPHRLAAALLSGAAIGAMHPAGRSPTARVPMPGQPAGAPATGLETASAVPTESYKTLAKKLAGTGLQAHHLNQNAVFRDIIPEDDGLTVGMKGNAFSEVGSPHYKVHSSLEDFWFSYRKTGDSFGVIPTNEQYGKAVEQALIHSGYTPAQAANLAEQAAAQRAAYGLMPSMPVPRIPGRLSQTKPQT